MPHWNWGQPENGVIQMAFIVPDIKAALPAYAKQLNVGPWFVIEHFAFDWVRYRGQPTDVDLTLALGFSGGMMFELIQQNNDVPSVYTEVRDQRGWGFHHFAVACTPQSYDDVLKGYLADGYDLALEAEVAVGGRAAYVDSRRDLPGMIELIEVTPKVEALFTPMRLANVGWDGSDPVRIVG
ncbi:VOC family protein [Parapedomonas caeni]|jgi:hypothetical protein